MLLRELYEAEKAATLAFGRMNPPTIGHKKLVDVVAKQSGDPFLFITHTQKPKTDPLDFQTKLKFATKFFPNVTVGDSSVNTIIKALQKLESMGYTSITYVAGSDRVDDFKNLITKYNGKDYNFKNIEIVSAGERDPDADGAEGMSASKMRAAAMSDDFDAFKQGVVDQSLANALYDAVRKGMGVTEKITKRTPMGDVVKDFYKSDAPQFKGKSKAKRRQMAIAAKLSKMDEMLAELKVTQQRPKIDVLTNIAVRKDSAPFPLSYKDTGNQTASTGGKLFIAPADADKFIKFYDTRAEDEQELMQKALKSMQTANKLFTNLGIKVRVEPSSYNESELVLDKSALITHLQQAIEKFASEEEDVEKLSYILKQLSGKKIKPRHGKYYTVTDEDIQEGIRSAIKNLTGPGYYSLDKDNPDHPADVSNKLRKRLKKKK